MNRLVLINILALGFGMSGVMKATLLLPVYTPIACGGSGQVACSVTPTAMTPTSQQLLGLTPSLVTAYLNSQGIVTTGVSLSARLANANGYVLGEAGGSGNIDVEFIYHAGQVNCCPFDHPFILNDVNDHNIVVGGGLGSGFFPFIGDASASNPAQGLSLTFTDPTFFRSIYSVTT